VPFGAIHVLARFFVLPSFQDACVARDRTVYSFPLFVLFTSASFPKNPINLTVLSYMEKSPLMP
jgi:hypothetical protein